MITNSIEFRMIVSKLPSGNINHSELMNIDIAKSVSEQLNDDYGDGTHILATEDDLNLIKKGIISGPVMLILSGQKNKLAIENAFSEPQVNRARSPRV